jgi:type IV pilus assembly protein PilW
MRQYIDIRHQAGLSLVEMMVGMVVGLLATLVIMQAFTAFEGQRRATTGTADAQTNGSLALMNIQRDLQTAGFGLSFPMADTENNLFQCDPLPPPYDPDNDPGTDNNIESIFPIEIQNGAGDGSDILISRTSIKPTGAVALRIKGAVASVDEVPVPRNIGCKEGDIVLLSMNASCALTRVVESDEDLKDDPFFIGLDDTGLEAGTPPLDFQARLTCMGKWLPEDERELVESRYEVVDNQLLRNGTPLIDEIVMLQAQYGITATVDSNQVTQWVDPVDQWSAANLALNRDNRNRIRAVRVAVVARNGKREQEIVTKECETFQGVVNNGPCAWDDEGYDASPMIDLSTVDADWAYYRFRSFDTIVPLRNMLWSRDAL